MLGSRVVVGGALLCAWLFSCSGSESHEFDCAVGSLNCNCGAEDHCKDGLVCNPRNQCVKPTNGSAGDGSGADGGSAGTSSSGGKGSGKAGKGQGKGGRGAGATGGSSSGEGGGGAAGETPGGSGGTAVSGAAGDGPAGAGGESGQAGSGGTLGGGAGGTAGAAAASGLGGTSGAGGSVAGAGGSVAGAGGGGAGGVGGSDAGAAGMSGGEAGAGGAGRECAEIALPPTMSLRNYTDAPIYFRYDYQTTKNVGEGDADFVTIAFWNVGIFDGGATGKFTLGAEPDDNTATCSRCVLGEQDRKTGTSVVFLASSGEMDIADKSDQMNGFPVVTLTDVTLSEVTISNAGISSPVPDGRCWHIASASIEFPKAWTCDATYYAGTDGCDCGCGTLDGDCAGSDVTACDWCYCPGDALDCGTNSVVKDDNGLCE